MLNYNHLMSTNDILSKPYDERKIRPVANLNSGTTCFFSVQCEGVLILSDTNLSLTNHFFET